MIALVEPIANDRRKRRPRAEAVPEPATSSRPQRELVLEGLLAPGLRVRVWSVAQPLTPSRV